MSLDRPGQYSKEKHMHGKLFIKRKDLKLKKVLELIFKSITDFIYTATQSFPTLNKIGLLK